MKKTVLYIIDSLAGIGGTEQGLIASLEDIHRSYNIILVTLYPDNVFEKDYFIGDTQYCLYLNSPLGILAAGKRLKKIIEKNNVDFVHSFLYWSTVVARLACGRRTPHVFKLTTVMTKHVYRSRWYSGYTQLIDRLTYKKNQVVVSPTNEVLKDFDRAIGIKGKSKVISNFVLDNFFENYVAYKPPCRQLKFVAVGNIKEIKNYQVIIDAFCLLKHLPISLDIYGFGKLRDSQIKQITENNLCIQVMGSRNKIYNVLPGYHAFIMSSFVEGFGISTAEAMAAGLPLLLSDIEVLREVSDGNAIFFDPYDAKTLADAIISVFEDRMRLISYSEKGKAIAKEKYTKEKYVNDVMDLYRDIATNSSNHETQPNA